MTVMTHYNLFFFFCFHSRCSNITTHIQYTYVFPGTLVPHVFGVLLMCSNLEPEYKTTTFFQMHFQEKNIVLYSGQYGIYTYL